MNSKPKSLYVTFICVGVCKWLHETPLVLSYRPVTKGAREVLAEAARSNRVNTSFRCKKCGEFMPDTWVSVVRTKEIVKRQNKIKV